jgi:putative MATE family efflux protein
VAAAAPARAVTGPIGRELFRLAAPLYASYLLRVAYQWVDALWVRGLGVEATAAVTTSVFVLWSAYSLVDVFGLGVAAYVSQLVGAGDRRRAGVAAYQALRAVAALSVVASLAGIFGSRQIYQLMGADPVVTEQGARYLTIVLGGAPLPMLALTCEAIMRSAGNTRTPMLVDLGAVALNAALDPLLIYGWGPVPAMGVAGAAWATVIAQAVMLASYLALAARGHPAFPLARTAPGAPIRIWGLARVGAPVALIGVLFSLVYVAFTRAAAAYGPAAMAVVGVSNRIEALQFVNANALGAAGATLLGQNLGAGRPDRAVQVLRTANLWNVGISALFTVAYWVMPETFLRLFSNDPEVVRLGADYLRVLALCIVFNGVEIVTAEAVLGSGHTRAISAIFTVFSLARVPLAFLMTGWFGGVVGIAWLITITCIVRAAAILAWVLRGTWKAGLGKELGTGRAPEAAATEIGP